MLRRQEVRGGAAGGALHEVRIARQPHLCRGCRAARDVVRPEDHARRGPGAPQLQARHHQAPQRPQGLPPPHGPLHGGGRLVQVPRPQVLGEGHPAHVHQEHRGISRPQFGADRLLRALMTFRKIDYLEWARTHMGRVKYDLAKSNIKALTKEELGLTLDAVQLSAPTDDGVVELTDLLAKRYGLPRTQVMVTSGATMAIWL